MVKDVIAEREKDWPPGHAFRRLDHVRMMADN